MTLPNWKPIKGTALIERRSRRAARVSAEQREMRAAKKRDRGKCRWPSCQYAKQGIPIDAAHIIRHRGMGGNPSGERTSRNCVAALCRFHHGMLDSAVIDIQPLTDAGTDGPMAFYWVNKMTGQFELIVSETSFQGFN